jgi:carboxylesterase type B
MSSTECLNLNISVPTSPADTPSDAAYPVMVFMHGGAFVYAGGNAPIYDGRVLAQISAELKIPTIIIAVTFRLGAFGFLASKEIRGYNEQHGEGGVGNYGLWDQVEALRWIQKHIRAFGGDPGKVTLFGQSAGGVSTNVHLLRGEKLFSSAIIQSGLLPLCGVMSEEQYQVIYDKLLDELEVPKTLSPQERLQRLIEIDEAKLTAAMMPIGIIPVLTYSPCDDHFLVGDQKMPEYSDYTNFGLPEWCQRLVIGDVANECIIWNKSYRELDAAGLLSRIKSFLNDDAKAKKIIDLYDIREDMTHNETFWKIEKMTTDGLYAAVDWTAIRACPKVYAYHFDIPSPFENDWGGLAHHSLDNVYIWGLLKDHLPEHHHAVSAKMSEYWLRFANGEEPWERFDKHGKFMIFEDDQCVLKTVEEDKERGYAKWEAIEREDWLDDFRWLCDDLCMWRREMLDPSVKPKVMDVGGFEEYGILAKNSRLAK